jgi:hypothetical protein
MEVLARMLIQENDSAVSFARHRCQKRITTYYRFGEEDKPSVRKNNND